MKEKDLIKLNFKKNIVTAEESGDYEFYYYSYDFKNGFSLISSENNDNNDFTVEIFNETDFSFSNIEDVKKLIKILTKNIKNEI